MGRNTQRYPVEKDNSLWHMYKTVSFWKVVKNFIVIEVSRVTPFLRVKNWMYRHLLKMNVGERTSFALKVTPDVMYRSEFRSGAIQLSVFRRQF